MEQIIDAIDRKLIREELEGHLLRPSNKGGNLIYDITSHEAPNTMREIGRLREMSYRAGGGATGKEMDIDDMDMMAKPYHQLVVWDPDNEEIISGYRYLLGHEAVLDAQGQPYITSAHLFHYSEKFIREYLPHTIEFGRAFVQPKYQTREMGVKALFALDNVWDGIGAIMHNNPDIYYMIGKVTIYPSYPVEARELIYDYLNRYHKGEEGLFGPYHPLELKAVKDAPFAGEDKQENYHVLQKAVREMGAVIPPMFSAYLNLTNDLQFFGNAMNDELANVYETGIMVDLRTVYEDKIQRYIAPYKEWLKR